MINGIINILKPTGMSSHDVVGQVRRICGMKKVGHAGTLDPLAAGVLPIYLGQATRLIEYGNNEVKTYHAEFLFGLATDTEDTTGHVVATGPIPDVSGTELSGILQQFCGDIEQTPSRYSAVNVNGVKAYKLARQHKEFTLPSRKVTVFEIRLLSYSDGRGLMRVTCSKGTYMRSLIRDLGNVMGTCAVMSYLVRVRAGVFDINEAATLEELAVDPPRYVMPIDASIQELKKVCLNEAQCRFLMQGRPVSFSGEGLTDHTVLRIYGPDNNLAGIAYFNEECHVIHPHKMFMEAL